MITKLLKICERTHKSSINIRLAAAEAFTSATIGGVLCSFTSKPIAEIEPTGELVVGVRLKKAKQFGGCNPFFFHKRFKLKLYNTIYRL